MSDTGVPAIPPPGAPSEPLAKVGGAVTVVTAVIALVVAFGLKLSDAQVAAILGVVAVIAPIITTLWGRLKVWSPASVRAALLAKAPATRRTMPYTTPGTGGNPIAPADGT